MRSLTFIGGLRYDDNSAYQSRVSPKLAANYKVNDNYASMHLMAQVLKHRISGKCFLIS
jgi:outer membrane cobalamin receptor